MSEKQIQKEIEMKLSKNGIRLFRNNTGVGWVGDCTKLNNGSLIVANPRPLHAGLQKGSSDLIGWKSITITPDMVGKKIAVFAAIEVKDKGKKPTEEQKTFINCVKAFGGIAGVARSLDEAQNIFSEF